MHHLCLKTHSSIET